MLDLLLGRGGVWIVGMLLILGSFGTGYLRGKLDEQEKQKLAAAEFIVKQIERIKTVYVNDGKVADAYEQGRKQREDEFNKLKAELDRAKLETIPASCSIPDDVVRLLNSTRSSGLSSGSAKPSSSLRGTGSLGGWASNHLGSYHPD